LQPPAPPQTKSWDATTIRSWNDKYFPTTKGWRNDGYYIYQGQAQDWNGQYGNHKGCFWFNNDNIRLTVQGLTIHSIRLRLARKSSGGYTMNKIPAQLWTITSPESVVNVSEPVLGTNYGDVASYAWGDDFYIDIPEAILTALLNNTAKGFCLYVPDSDSIEQYMIMENIAKLEITYE
jgi:hypothetical protein